MGKTKTHITRPPSRSVSRSTSDQLQAMPGCEDDAMQPRLSPVIRRRAGDDRQRRISSVPQVEIPVSNTGDLDEQEADEVANRVVTGQMIAPISRLTRGKNTKSRIQAQFGHVPATPGWGARVQQAGRDNSEIDLLNHVYISMYPDIPRRFSELTFPVRARAAGQEDDGGVYFDASLTDPGMTDQRRVTTGGSCSGCSCTPEQTETYVFILLGPNAVSEGTPRYSEYVLYHEYVHYQQRKGQMHSGLLTGSSRARLSIHREALAHAESFRQYFGRLYWQGSGRMPGSRTPAEAINSLESINRFYYIQSEAPVRAEVLRIVTSVIADPRRSEKRDFLLELVGHLAVSGWTRQSELGNDLRQAIARLP